MLHVRSKLYLGLKSTKLAGFLKGDRVGAIQDVIPGLKHISKEQPQEFGGDHASPRHGPAPAHAPHTVED